jgi:CBS domain-containing protein
MSVASLCKREVVTVRPGDDLAVAARLMREKHVGYLVVVDSESNDLTAPKGVITDRDIVVAVVAQEVSPHSLSVGDVMTREPLVLEEHTSVNTALARMRKAGVRRAPVVAANGGLFGVLSVDDVLDELSGQLLSIAGSIRNEQRVERRVRP